jgi:hypothetical protein
VAESEKLGKMTANVEFQRSLCSDIVSRCSSCAMCVCVFVCFCVCVCVCVRCHYQQVAHTYYLTLKCPTNSLMQHLLMLMRSHGDVSKALTAATASLEQAQHRLADTHKQLQDEREQARRRDAELRRMEEEVQESQARLCLCVCVCVRASVRVCARD